MTDTVLTTIPSLEALPLREMTREEGKIYLELMIAENSGRVPALSEKEARECGPFGMMTFQRLRLHGLHEAVTMPMFIWLMELSKGVPGNITVWCWTLHQIRKDYKLIAPITLEDFGLRFFPRGIPTDAAYDQLWVAQKTENGQNRLDKAETWVA